MEENKCNSKEKIINATLKLIGEEGFQKVTVRKIASLAQVNVASVNYYFGSKDNAVNEALMYLTEKFMDCFKYLRDKTLPPDERLRCFLMNYADACLQYPDVLRNFISQSMSNYDVPCNYAEFIKKEGIEELRSIFKEIGSEMDDSEAFMRIFQLISCIAFPVLMGNHMEKSWKIDYYNKEIRGRYIDLLLNSLIC